MKKVAIEVNNLNMKYSKKERFVLDNVSMKVYEGDLHGFIGPNGAGKTTFIKLLIGGLKAKSGEIKIFNHPPNSVFVKERIGYVPEKASFLKGKHETTKNYLIDLAYMNGISFSEAIKRIKNLARILKLDDNLLKGVPHSFSSGQKKRVLIAQALLCNPKLLILDEPASNLDPESRKFLFNLLQNLNKRKKITIFISSHILSELQQIVSGWTILDNGKIQVNFSLEKEEDKRIFYKIKTNQKNKLKGVLKNNYEVLDFDDNNEICISLKNKLEVINLQKDIVRSKIEILSFIDASEHLELWYKIHVMKNKK